MYFVEFFEPRPGVPYDKFRTVVTEYLSGWAAEHPDDELVCTIGRRWWLGPEPGYMTIWKVADTSVFERWEDELSEPTAAKGNREFDEVARIVQAGLYEDL
jgi:hypothetical protein